jgi:SAM-dependent methyltransferase
MDYRAYAEDGRQTAREILELVRPWLPKDGRVPVVLDWGCGPGRVVRHWKGLLGGNGVVMGTDYNERYVAWCKSHLKESQFLLNRLDPPLDMGDGSADLIYGLSIFTHLSEERHHTWAGELYRVLGPGGVLVLTVQGDGSRYKLLPAEQERYNRGELVVRGYQKEGHRLYAAFQPPAFMRLLFGRFAVLRHITGGEPGGLDGMQDTWVLQKPLPQR